VSTFTALVTQDERVLVTRDGRTVAVLAGQDAHRLATTLSRSADEASRQRLLARATGNYERGNER
jgi:antitoxin (DNA-binding transcriptional repressor) of toxin-antitoxin stability system